MFFFIILVAATILLKVKRNIRGKSHILVLARPAAEASDLLQIFFNGSGYLIGTENIWGCAKNISFNLLG